MTSPQHRLSPVGHLRTAVLAALLFTAPLFGTTAAAQAATQSQQATVTAAAAQWTGWAEVPGGGATPDSPAAVSYNGAQNVFVRGTDNAIYRNVLSAGAWSGWAQVPGNGATTSALGADTFTGTLQLFARGTDNRIYRNVLVP